MKLQLSYGKAKSSLDFPDLSPSEISVQDLEKKLLKEVFKKSKDRMCIRTLDKVILPSGSKDTLDKYLREGDEIIVKDLGPQISWKTVFMVEYLGPIIIHPLFYYFAETIHGAPFQASVLQKTTLFLIVLHFLKREYETMYVHRFSHATMPLSNLFKNSAHYHFLSGVLIAYSVYSPKYSQPQEIENPLYFYFCIGLYAFGEISNFMTHIALRNLRPPGTRTRAIPYGYGFDLVSCPNYFFETLAWVAICLLTGNWASWLFTAVAFGQMYVWALKKHSQYKKDFPDYPKGRKAIVPFFA
ncbi:3-oxo-5a-steroid 4- dehydrogenase [Entomophthora muscae]|uniref:3-oxo-5a-steroid 4- dehydrogenase n=1 Tax=Entomophthora muscae TaxID=34485 RepID=A0ACC2U869_9FUNG|nr:3-oxo-5a-steroid 4- dehydrogenase [Entomophthora muscae]